MTNGTDNTKQFYITIFFFVFSVIEMKDYSTKEPPLRVHMSATQTSRTVVYFKINKYLKYLVMLVDWLYD